MTLAGPRVAVVGAGIVGVTIAHRLAVRGARVRLFDRGAAGGGTTDAAFGWVGIAGAGPGEADAALRLRREAIGRWTDLNAELGGALFRRSVGAILWQREPAATERQAELLRAAGSRVALLAPRQFRNLEPGVAEVPPCAVHSPDDLALAPARAVEALLRAARAAGAEWCPDVAVDGIATRGGAVAGVGVGSATWQADFVVLAAGTATAGLAAPFLPDLPLATSPALLLAFAAPGRVLRHILCGPELEVRQPAADRLLVAEDCPDPADRSALEALSMATGAAVRRVFALEGPVTPTFLRIGRRPMQQGPLPLLGPVRALPGLLLAVGHPGVILAPAMAEAMVAAILEGRVVFPLRALP